jgi:hypothetical protein
MIQLQNYLIEMFVLLFLIVLSYLDLKKKEFPAVLTSGALFVVAFAKFQNIEFGVMAFILAWFLMEFDFFGGTADLKVITMMGFFISSLGLFLIYTMLIVIFGTTYKVLMVKVVKMKETDEIAFVPVLLIIFVALSIVRYLT